VSLNWWATLLIVIASEVIPYATVKIAGLEDDAMYYWMKDNMLPYYGLMAFTEAMTLLLLNRFSVFWVTAALVVGVTLRLGLHLSVIIGYWIAPHHHIVDAYIDGYYYAIIQLLVILQVFVFGISPWLADRRFHTDSSGAF